MKKIDYNKSKGTFKIKYLDDGDIIEGTINIDSNSINTNLKKDILEHNVGDIFDYSFTNETNYENIIYKIQLLEKNIELLYNDNDKRFDLFCNIGDVTKISEDKIYFKFYYKSNEYKVHNTISYRIINGLKKYDDCDINYNNFIDITEGYNFFKACFIKYLLKKFDFSDYILCCVPSHNSSIRNNNTLASMIVELSRDFNFIDGSQVLIRYKDCYEQKKSKIRTKEPILNSVKVSKNVTGKKLLLIDDITISGSSLLACRDLLIESGAAEVICFAFAH